MRKLLTVAVLATLAVVALADTAAASHNGKLSGRDFAVGGGKVDTAHFAFSAHQVEGVFGTGQVTYRTPTQRIHGDVVCLGVSGNLAFILAEITRFSGDPPLAERIAFEVTDGGPGGEGDGFSTFFASPVLGCRLPAFGGAFPTTSGNIVVHDGEPG